MNNSQKNLLKDFALLGYLFTILVLLMYSLCNDNNYTGIAAGVLITIGGFLLYKKEGRKDE